MSVKRDPASVTLIALRKAMGKTQAQFAVEVVKTAVTTVARWETGGPPRGKALLQLRDVARSQGLTGLAMIFERIWTREMFKELGESILLDEAEAPLKLMRKLVANGWVEAG